ncbi:MAG: glutathione S-transferase [Myxococcota bacterium]
MVQAFSIPRRPQLVLCELEHRDGALETHSPFCLKIRRSLSLLGLKYESRASASPRAFKHLNPRGKVPVLLIDGEAIADSTRILLHLNRLYPGVLYRHRESGLWEELADTSLNAHLVAARWADPDQWKRTRKAFFGSMPWPLRAVLPVRIRRSVLRSLEARDIEYQDTERHEDAFLTMLDDFEARAPKKGFWLGEYPDAADLAIFSQLQSMRCELTPKQHRWIDQRRALGSYLRRVERATAIEAG